MAIEQLLTWLPALLGYLIPIGLFLLAWGGMPPERARRSVTVAALALALAVLGYFAVGFAFHLGGAALVYAAPGLEGLDHLYAGGDKLWGLVGVEGFFLTRDAGTTEAMGLFVIYLPMVTTAVLLPILSLYGRARDWQVILVGLWVSLLLFPIVACWAWGGGWLANIGMTLERGHGFVDHSGSVVVYLLGGMVALGALVGLGKRTPPGQPGEPAEMPPAHFPLLANLGSLLFALGWLGWALSTPFHTLPARENLNPSLIAVNGLLAVAGAALVTQVYCWITVGRADPLMTARGAVAGLVAVSAGAPFFAPGAALGVGVVAGLILPLGVYLVERVFRLPDGTAAAPIGALAGGLGGLAVAFLANGQWGGGWNGIGLDEYQGVVGQGVTGFWPTGHFVGDGPGQLIAQVIGIGVVTGLAFLSGWAILAISNLPYRSPREHPETSSPDATDVERSDSLWSRLTRLGATLGRTSAHFESADEHEADEEAK